MKVLVFAVVVLATIALPAQACAPPPMPGITLRQNQDWLVGLFSSLSVTRANPAAVASMCISNPRCLAYNSRGQMLIGQPGTRVTYLRGFPGFCTYVKDPNFKPAPSCAPPKAGYTLRRDTNFAGQSIAQTTPANAEAKCNADPNCVAWNSFGYTISGDRAAVTYSPYNGLCVYVKDAPACAPPKKGYTLKANSNFAGPGITQTTPGAAEAKCNADPRCVAWNTLGYTISVSNREKVTYPAYNGLCVYVKDPPPACPQKRGYKALADTNWKGSTVTKESQTTAENAQRICNLDANCVAWNSFGYYILGQPFDVTYTPYQGMCTYVKEGRAAASNYGH